MSADDIERMNEIFSFFPVSDDIKQEIYSECKEYLTETEMNLRTCAVRNVLKKENEFVTEISNTFNRRCRNRLAPDTCIPPYLLEFYDVSAFIPELENVLLSKKV